MSKTVKQILSEAADHIERVGFHQGSHFKYGDEDIETPFENLPCCIRGAFIAVVGWADFMLRRDARLAVADYLGLDGEPEPFDDWAEPVAIWNDTPGRTKEEVIAALRGAAASIEEQP